MNSAERAAAKVIESTLHKSPAFRKVEDRLYVIKQGSSYVLLNIVPWGENRALVRCVAQLVKGVRMDCDLATELLRMNGVLRFGAFAYVPEDKIVLFQHSMLGGSSLDPEELMATLSDVALIADEYDDKLVREHGGQTMGDLLEEAALDRVLSQTQPEVIGRKKN